jgi:hypothetical protein
LTLTNARSLLFLIFILAATRAKVKLLMSIRLSDKLLTIILPLSEEIDWFNCYLSHFNPLLFLNLLVLVKLFFFSSRNMTRFLITPGTLKLSTPNSSLLLTHYSLLITHYPLLITILQ